MPDTRITSVMMDDNTLNVNKEVDMVFSIANTLRGPYKADKYKDIIIPMIIIRRLECALDTKGADGKVRKTKVVEAYKKNKNTPPQILERLSGFPFYNTSVFTLGELLHESPAIVSNFKFYVKSFSPNIKEILIERLRFENIIKDLDKNNRLLGVVKKFSELDLNPETIDSHKMGYMFEEIIRRFSENAEAGDHYTPREVIRLLSSILLAEGCDDIFNEGKEITVLDMACGTGGMLSTTHDFIKRMNPDANIRLFGQENNPESYAICLADMLIKGQKADNIRFADTMRDDCFSNTPMQFVIANPPFGLAWGGKDAGEGVEDAVKTEYAKGLSGRWGAGLPGTGDMQMLFLQSAIDKLNPTNGRAAIIEDGSPLFVGGTASGESQIRRWFLENDYIEAIIALPTDLFYNTGIATYIWILSMNKRPERKGRIQLIDATTLCHKLRKPLGNKKNEIGPEERKAITDLYLRFEENEQCKIYPNTEFIYREYSVMQPLQRAYAINDERIENLLLSGVFGYSEFRLSACCKRQRQKCQFYDKAQEF